MKFAVALTSSLIIAQFGGTLAVTSDTVPNSRSANYVNFCQVAVDDFITKSYNLKQVMKFANGQIKVFAKDQTLTEVQKFFLNLARIQANSVYAHALAIRSQSYTITKKDKAEINVAVRTLDGHLEFAKERSTTEDQRIELSIAVAKEVKKAKEVMYANCR